MFDIVSLSITPWLLVFFYLGYKYHYKRKAPHSVKTTMDQEVQFVSPDDQNLKEQFEYLFNEYEEDIDFHKGRTKMLLRENFDLCYENKNLRDEVNQLKKSGLQSGKSKTPTLNQLFGGGVHVYKKQKTESDNEEKREASPKDGYQKQTKLEANDRLIGDLKKKLTSKLQEKSDQWTADENTGQTKNFRITELQRKIRLHQQAYKKQTDEYKQQIQKLKKQIEQNEQDEATKEEKRRKLILESQEYQQLQQEHEQIQAQLREKEDVINLMSKDFRRPTFNESILENTKLLTRKRSKSGDEFELTVTVTNEDPQMKIIEQKDIEIQVLLQQIDDLKTSNTSMKAAYCKLHQESHAQAQEQVKLPLEKFSTKLLAHNITHNYLSQQQKLLQENEQLSNEVDQLSEEVEELHSFVQTLLRQVEEHDVKMNFNDHYLNTAKKLKIKSLRSNAENEETSPENKISRSFDLIE